MPFSGSDLFDFLCKLNSKKDEFDHSQALSRTLVNRAYYSAFLEARAFVGISEYETDRVHKKVSDQMTVRDTLVGNRLKDLLKLRKNADYKVIQGLNSKDVSKAIRLSGLVIKYCQNSS